jgi:hypothetical protein
MKLERHWAWLTRGMEMPGAYRALLVDPAERAGKIWSVALFGDAGNFKAPRRVRSSHLPATMSPSGYFPEPPSVSVPMRSRSAIDALPIAGHRPDTIGTAPCASVRTMGEVLAATSAPLAITDMAGRTARRVSITEAPRVEERSLEPSTALARGAVAASAAESARANPAELDTAAAPSPMHTMQVMSRARLATVLRANVSAAPVHAARSVPVEVASEAPAAALYPAAPSLAGAGPLYPAVMPSPATAAPAASTAIPQAPSQAGLPSALAPDIETVLDALQRRVELQFLRAYGTPGRY